jgi:RimJ/RimL family protein N-acetyltransferase
MPLPIETERLVLRKYEDQDLMDIVSYSSSTDFWLLRNLDWKPNERDTRRYWENQRSVQPEDDPSWLALVIDLKDAGKVIGNTGLGVIKTGEHRQGTIGWVLGSEYQGRGYATEAASSLLSFGFEELDLHRISARTGLDNTRSWHLMERLGMRREALFKESHIVKGEWRDEVIYALLAEEWITKEEG